MHGASLAGSMFDDPALQELVQIARARYGKAGLVVLAELCRRELNSDASTFSRPSLVGP
jgi:hypothetical protein